MAFLMVNLPRGEAEQDGDEGAPAQAPEGPQPAGQDAQPLVVNIINIFYDPNAVQLVVENEIPAEERNLPPPRLNGEAEIENEIGAGQRRQQRDAVAIALEAAEVALAPDQGAGPDIEEVFPDDDVPVKKWSDSGVDPGYEPDDERDGDSSSDDEEGEQLYE